MSEQLILDLPLRAAFGREAFVVSEANAQALALIERWADWPDHRLFLHGPSGAGKTHLAAVWASLSQAFVVEAVTLTEDRLPQFTAHPLVVENIDQITPHMETTLFHLLNLARENNTPLLLTAQSPAAQLSIVLPDLKSRLDAMTSVGINAPDDALLAALLMKQFADRQLEVAPQLVSYIVPRMERSFEAAQTLAAALDAEALRCKSKVTRAMVRKELNL